jgi:hypothetical protein
MASHGRGFLFNKRLSTVGYGSGLEEFSRGSTFLKCAKASVPASFHTAPGPLSGA